MDKKILIIGGGVSGLTSGIYGQKNGFETVILERGEVSGGLCTGWSRFGHYIDGCIHWLIGTSRFSPFYAMWKELGAFNSDSDIYFQNNYATFEYRGRTVTFWSDLKRTEEELLAQFPLDSKEIKKFIKMVVTAINVPLPVERSVNTMPFNQVVYTGWSLFPYIPFFLRTMRMSLSKYAKRFKDPSLRFAMKNLLPNDNSLYAALYSYGNIAFGNGGVPVKGSLQLAKNIEEKYLSLGGRLRLKSEVLEILIDNQTAYGVRLVNGEIIYADYIISSCDPEVTLKKLLNNQYADRPIQKRYDSPGKNICPSCCLVSFAFDDKTARDLFGNSIRMFFDTSEFHCGNQTLSEIDLRFYHYGDKFVRNDRVLVTSLVPLSNNDYDYWKDLSENKIEYKNTKNQLAHDLLDRIVVQYPLLEGKIKILDVSTPVTFNRYTDGHKGTYMPFTLNSKHGLLLHNGHVKGINNLYLSGQWTMTPGGLPMAAISGLFSVQRIMKREKFRSIFTNKKRHKYYSGI